MSTRDDFDNDLDFTNYLKEIIQNTLGNSISKFLLKRLGVAGGLPGFLVPTTIDWGLTFLIDKLTGIERAANETICSAIDELEESTITIVASERDIARIEGDILILHFVTMDNYPKRKRGSNKRPIRIPAPKAEYDWDVDFKDIRWVQGNQYAKLKLEGYKQGISGWFKNADSANATFDRLMQLTTATEKGRNIPNHTNGRDDIVERETRPYRAWIACEETPGEGKTLTKYFPPSENEEN